MPIARYGVLLAAAALALGCNAPSAPETSGEPPAAKHAGTDLVPIYEWDPHWPQLPLPNNWAMGNVAGLDVDGDDHVWVLKSAASSPSPTPSAWTATTTSTWARA